MRIITLVAMVLVASYNIYQGYVLGDMLVIYATLVLIHSILILRPPFFSLRSFCVSP